MIRTLKSLSRARGTTALAVMAIALGVGANTALFSAVRAVLLRPLPYAHADRLVTLWERNPSKVLERQRLPPARYLEFKGQRDIFEDVAAYNFFDQNLTGIGEPDRVRVAMVAGDFFALTGAAALGGRLITPGDAAPDAPAVAVVSARLWRQRLGSGSLEGRTLRLDDRPYQVIGVVPASFDLPAGADVYIPLDDPVPGVARQPVAVHDRPAGRRRRCRDRARPRRAGVRPSRVGVSRHGRRVDHDPHAARRRHRRLRRPGASDPDGRGGAGAAHRLRGRGQPAARPRGGPAPRAGRAAGARRLARAAPPPARRREPGGVGGGRRDRPRAGGLGGARARAARLRALRSDPTSTAWCSRSRPGSRSSPVWRPARRRRSCRRAAIWRARWPTAAARSRATPRAAGSARRSSWRKWRSPWRSPRAPRSSPSACSA